MTMKIIRQKPYKAVHVGEFDFRFYYKENNLKRSYLSINTTSGVFALRIGGNTHAFGCLLAAAMQDRIDQLRGYAVMLVYQMGGLIKSQKLTDDVTRAIHDDMERIMQKGAERAENVSDTENEADEALMRESIRRAKGDVSEEQSREEIKNVLSEDSESKSE